MRLFCFGILMGIGLTVMANQFLGTHFNGGDRARAGLLFGAALGLLGRDARGGGK